MKYLKWLNPFEWGALALQIMGGLLAAGLLFWYANSKLEDHYTSELQQEVKVAADKGAAAVTARNLENETRRSEALNAKNKQLEAIMANSKRVAAADDRLRDSLRASATSRTEISACVQRADTLDAVQLAIRGFTKRVAQECDRHIADKEALKSAWPQ
jgi:hypothetical protein